MTTRNQRIRYFAALVLITTSVLVPQAQAGFDALTFKQATDQGYYLNVEQSKTLGRMGHAIGFTGDYSLNSLVLRDSSGNKVQDVIQKEVGLNLGGALGLTNWLDVGVSVDGVAYQQFLTPGTLVQDNGSRLGDISANLKIQLVNSENSAVGLAIVPFITFPTGNDNYFVGNEGVTGGGKLVLDTKRIADRVSFSLNAGAQFRDDVTTPSSSNVIGDEFNYGAGMNVEIAKPLQFIAEAHGTTQLNNLFEKNHRNLEADGALRFIPDKKQNFLITAGGGAGLHQGAGVPLYRAFTTVALRFPRPAEVVVAAAPPAIVAAPIEEVISTNTIHFVFAKSVIQAASYGTLEQILADIQGRPEVEFVRVEGHTDSIGSDQANQKLSEARANSVRTFLIKRGYPSDKISAVGMGESTPIDDNTTKAGRAMNRRVEFHLQLQNAAHLTVKKSADVAPTFEEGTTR